MVGKIVCSSVERFVEVLAGLVRCGIVFNADADALVIELNGGY